jgi:hypothetical protein
MDTHVPEVSANVLEQVVHAVELVHVAQLAPQAWHTPGAAEVEVEY